MDFVTWARSPWGEDILTHISWSLFWASLVGGVLFLVAHGGYMLFSRHDKRDPAEVDRMEARAPGPAGEDSRGTRSWLAMFHWVMAASMLVLVDHRVLPDRSASSSPGSNGTGWPAILLTGSILFHIVHAIVLPRLLVDLGRPERHPGVQGGDDARDRQGARRRRSRASTRWATGCITWS